MTQPQLPPDFFKGIPRFNLQNEKTYPECIKCHKNIDKNGQIDLCNNSCKTSICIHCNTHFYDNKIGHDPNCGIDQHMKIKKYTTFDLLDINGIPIK